MTTAAFLAGASGTAAMSPASAAALPSSSRAVAATPGSPAALTNVYTIRARLPDSANGKYECLDADANHAGAGAQIKINDCNGSNAQKWQSGEINDQPILINLAHGGTALGASSFAVGAVTATKAISVSDHTENWYWDANGVHQFDMYGEWNSQLVLAPIGSYQGARVYIRKLDGSVGLQSWTWIRLS